MRIENGILSNVYNEDIVNREFIAPNSVTEIGNDAFKNCIRLKSIIIPNSVTKIGDYAFYNCYNLESITMPDLVTEIGYNAFENCNDLESINVNKDNKYYSSKDGVLFNKDKTILIKYPQGRKDKKYVIPNSVIKIGDYAFSNCIELTSIIISDFVIKIGNYAFYYCYNLKDIIISNSIIEIGKEAFNNCIGLKSITIPDSVTKIGNDALTYANSLESINVTDGNKYYSSEDGILFNKDKTILIQYPQKKKDKKYTISDLVIKIEDLAFYNCNNLEFITIPDSVIEIGDIAFANCSNLKSKKGNYKAFKKGLICNGMQYIPNKWNKIDGEIKLCEWGLHYVTNLFDIFTYYHGDLEKDMEIWEVEVGDTIVGSEYDSKRATNAIKPIKKLNRKEIINILNNK